MVQSNTYNAKLNDIRVSIKDEYLHGLPFSLKSRNAVAIVFSFYGDSE